MGGDVVVITLLAVNILTMSALMLHSCLNIRKLKNKMFLLNGTDHEELSKYLIKKEIIACYCWGAVFLFFFIFFVFGMISILMP